ncbi:MAG TPA: hypothetical protein VF783_13835 [Terriglobales bacterium]
MSDDELFAVLSEIADEEIMAKNRESIIEVGRRILRLGAQAGDPVAWMTKGDWRPWLTTTHREVANIWRQDQREVIPLYRHSGLRPPMDMNTRNILSDGLAMYARHHHMAADQWRSIERALDIAASEPSSQ